MTFTSYIGIHYSGAEAPTSRLKTLSVYRADASSDPEKVITPDAYPFGPQNWSRQGIAEWVIEQTLEAPVVVGIGHCFSLPSAWFDLQTLPDWNEMLRHFPLWWPTHKNIYVDSLWEKSLAPPPCGTTDQLRITETRSRIAKSIFRFAGYGAMGKISWAGIPWLAHIRDNVGDRIHFWPFDGWEIPEGKSVIVEVCPFMFSRKFAKEKRKPHEHDAYAVARWLSEMDRSGKLSMYLNPPLDYEQKQMAEEREGWILGVM